MHKSQEELQIRLDRAKELVAIGAEYVHFKSPDMRYIVKDLVINVNDTDVWVVYQALYGENIVFIRSLDEWCEKVKIDQKTVSRFTRTV